MKPSELTAIKLATEQKFGHTISCLSDFERLSEAMGKLHLSITTLKRIWEYNKDYTEINEKSIDLLAIYVGYKNYQDFLETSPFKSADQHIIYAASQIAKLSEAIHSDRFDKAQALLAEHRFTEAENLFSNEDTDTQTAILCRDIAPFVENARAVIAQLIVRAHIVWCQKWDDENDSITQIEQIYNQALPLALTINDHALLWNIYQDYAFKQNQLRNVDEALANYELARTQAKILLLEDSDSIDLLASSVNDISMLLCDLERYEEAKQMLDEIISADLHPIISIYVILNYARALVGLDQTDQAVDYFNRAADAGALIGEDDLPFYEGLQVRAIALSNLGVLHEDRDKDVARRYYEQAIELFESREVPSILHRTNYYQCRERLAALK